MKLFPQNMVLPLKQWKKEVWIKKIILISMKSMILLDWEKLKKNKMRNAKYNQKIDGRKGTLWSPLNLSEKAFFLSERLLKKDVPSKLFKASTKNMPFFNRNRIFTIYKRAKLNNGSYLYWVEEVGKKNCLR